MTCNKCNHKLPDDSSFCQYCGKKIDIKSDELAKRIDSFEMLDDQTKDFNDSIATDEHKIDDMTKELALNEILKMQAKETIRVIEANSQFQPNNEDDIDFGLVPQKPIYTLGLMSVDGETEYLNKLYTVNGKKIKWTRRGSVSVDGVNGVIDIYDTFLPSGQLYKTIYINMYGANKSTRAPEGFVFARPKTVTKVSKDENRATKDCITKQIKKASGNDKFVLFINVSSIVLAVISMFLIIYAMNVQSVNRNIYEPLNPTVLYFILFDIYLTYIVYIILSNFIKKEKSFMLQYIFGFIPSVYLIVALIEGSLFSNTYFSNGHSHIYVNSDLLYIINTLLVIISFLILIINLLPLIVFIKYRIYQSVCYREKCYKRVEKMKEYLDKDIINEEEFERNKQNILKNIKR